MSARVLPEMLSLPELAARVGWPAWLVRRWWRQGMLPEPSEADPEPRWRRTDIERWLAGHDS